MGVEGSHGLGAKHTYSERLNLQLNATMSNTAFRDSSIVILETGTTFVRAGLGIHDLLHAPSIVQPSLVPWLPKLTQSLCRRSKLAWASVAGRSPTRKTRIR